ncbi:ATP-binding protein [Massilistercora timonensis]|uniref:ATP-binding protein n=1 Tax=Massilistercora timonensis TaxID=2086584 RepID=UPI003209443D
MREPVAGKFLLEILTRGMYSNSMHIYREYIQNSSDSIDKAIKEGIIEASEAEIHIIINENARSISIKDNGIGISKDTAKITLMNIGASDKDGIEERGFRGIGRLGGLAYADKVKFVTSACGDTVKTTMLCDCMRMQQLLQKSNTETSDVMETFKTISTFTEEPEESRAHYFEVELLGIQNGSDLLDEKKVLRYLAETAPIDFDSQQFSQARKIREYFAEKGFPISCYKILRGSRRIPVYKLYSRSLSTGKQKRTQNKDYVRDVEFIYKKASDGKPLYIGWLAITDFSGVITDESVQGIRFRKGNILVGSNTTFAKFFPSEGHNANRMFAGEIHVLHDELVPNSQRDDFEPNAIYNEMKEDLTIWAGTINRKYRRGTSEATSALRNLKKLNEEQKDLEEKINSGAITSDEKREQIVDKLEKIARNRETEEKKVRKALERGTFDSDRKETVKKTLQQSEFATQKVAAINTKIISADYATKNDLPSSYSRAERKIYQQIISIIDTYFENEPQIAEELRAKIKTELGAKKK